MDRIKAKLSEGPSAPAYDANPGSGEHLLSFDFSYLTVWFPWNTWAEVDPGNWTGS